MRFIIDWASLIVGSKFIVLLCFTLYLRAIFKYKPPRGGGGAYIWKGDLTEGFLRYRFGGVIFGGAYTWRGLFSEFYGSFCATPKIVPDRASVNPLGPKSVQHQFSPNNISRTTRLKVLRITKLMTKARIL